MAGVCITLGCTGSQWENTQSDSIALLAGVCITLGCTGSQWENTQSDNIALLAGVCIALGTSYAVTYENPPSQTKTITFLASSTFTDHTASDVLVTI